MKKLIVAAAVLFFTGCVNSDPTLANYVYRKGSGIYEAMDISNASQQCKLDGDKKLHIITSTQEYSYVTKRYHPLYIFECL